MSTLFFTKFENFPLKVVALTWASSMKWYSTYGGSLRGLLRMQLVVPHAVLPQPLPGRLLVLVGPRGEEAIVQRPA